ncbi:hypothetical protein LSH36_26g14019 [Paralvinella palmiformis]|uniref:Uncharacterized protein n=1 Tax=Paralvinella palmiformis TaxID=53620 RepID=A0AAD9K9M8_9ANNE|nr:hypothetical protein LSH36_26g14019 [Paralvinella palmiformis]
MYTPEADDVNLTGSDERVQRDHGADIKLALSRPHLSPTHVIGNMSARNTILSAVETLELENSRLLMANEQIMAQLVELRQENSQLRKELNAAALKCERLEEDKQRLEKKLREQNRHLAEESSRFAESNAVLRSELDARRRQCETARYDLARRDSDCRAFVRELDGLKRRLEQSERRLVENSDVEMFHEVEMLKAECKDLSSERDETLKVNKKLDNEMLKLQTSLDEKLSELRNENRRHSLLTKEFNSLLEENNHLKLQLRRGGQLARTSVSGEEGPTANVVVELIGNSQHRKKFSYSTSLARDTSSPLLADVAALSKVPRDRALISRDRTRLTRQSSAMRQDGGYRKVVINRRTARTSVRDLIPSRTGDERLPGTNNKSTGNRSDSDCSQSPDSLPSISGNKTWRP